MRILELENIIPKRSNSMFGFNSRDDRTKLMNLGINQQSTELTQSEQYRENRLKKMNGLRAL